MLSTKGGYECYMVTPRLQELQLQWGGEPEISTMTDPRGTRFKRAKKPTEILHRITAEEGHANVTYRVPSTGPCGISRQVLPCVPFQLAVPSVVSVKSDINNQAQERRLCCTRLECLPRVPRGGLTFTTSV